MVRYIELFLVVLCLLFFGCEINKIGIKNEHISKNISTVMENQIKVQNELADLQKQKDELIKEIENLKKN